MEKLQIHTKGMLDASESSTSSLGSRDVKSVKKHRFRRRIVWRCLWGFSVLILVVWIAYLQHRVFVLEQILQQPTKLDDFGTSYDDDVSGGGYDRNTQEVVPIKETEEEEKPSRNSTKKQRCEDVLEVALQTLQSFKWTLDHALEALNNITTDNRHSHPSIQLTLLEKHNNTILSDNLIWTDRTASSHSTTAEGKYTGVDQFFGFDEHTQAIHIRRTGRYVVYAQLTYGGRLHTNLNFPITNPDCSFSVELVEHNRNTRNNPKYGLLYASVTQHSLGRVIHRTVDGRALTAHDTAYTSGVFILRENERISLKSGWGTPCDVKTSEDKAFFGIYLLSENH